MIRNHGTYDMFGIVFPEPPLDSRGDEYVIDDTPVTFTKVGSRFYNSRLGDYLRKSILLGINSSEQTAACRDDIYDAIPYAHDHVIAISGSHDVSSEQIQLPPRTFAVVWGMAAVYLYHVDSAPQEILERDTLFPHDQFKYNDADTDRHLE